MNCTEKCAKDCAKNKKVRQENVKHIRDIYDETKLNDVIYRVKVKLDMDRMFS